jgi:hypothetical protein
VFAVDSAAAQTATLKNVETISLAAAAATSLEVVSGGTNASNVLNVTSAAKLASITVSGAANLDMTASASIATLTSVDASSFTGKLTVDLADMKAGASTLKLGAGVDTVFASAAASNATAYDSISGISKAAAAAVGTDATAATSAIAAADQLVFAGASVEANSTANGVKSGVLTFTGTGPSTLDAAFALADAATVGAVGDTVVFEYLGNSYVFVQGSTTAGVTAADTVIKLVGVTGITAIGETGTDHFFLV